MAIQLIRLLYGLTKGSLRQMRSKELDNVARQLASVEKDAAGQLGRKAQTQLDETKKAVDQEKRTRNIRDKEYGIMQDELRGASELIPVTKPPTLIEPPGVYIRDTTGMVTKTPPTGGYQSMARGGGDNVLPEFTTENLSRVLRKEGVDPNMDKLGWGGRLVSQASNPTKYANTTLESLNPFQREVYKTYTTLKNQANFPKELSHPGVLSDLLEEAGRVANVGELKAQIGGNASKYISDYWRKKGPMIRKEWNTIQETGDFNVGTSFEEIIEGITRID
jgi:hypothetical protein